MSDFSQADGETLKIPTGPGFTLTFFYYFSGSAAVLTLLAYKTLGIGAGSELTGPLCLLFGSIGGMVGAAVNRTVTLTLNVKSRKTFLRELDAALEELGYTLTDEDEEGDVRLYRRSPLRQLLSGKVYVQLQPKSAVVSSRALHIRSLKQRLAARAAAPSV